MEPTEAPLDQDISAAPCGSKNDGAGGEALTALRRRKLAESIGQVFGPVARTPHPVSHASPRGRRGRGRRIPGARSLFSYVPLAFSAAPPGKVRGVSSTGTMARRTLSEPQPPPRPIRRRLQRYCDEQLPRRRRS